jgi:hypothetical protein
MIRGSGFFSPPYDLTPPPPPPPYPVSTVSSIAGDTQEGRERETSLADGRGGRGEVVEEPNHTTAKSLALYKSFNNLGYKY